MLALLIDPLARGAYFDTVVPVARAELEATTGQAGTVVRRGPFTFLHVEAGPDEAERFQRLSWVQGAFRVDGEALVPLAATDGHELPAGLVWGAKYRGKTHEIVTRLAVNLALAHAETLPQTLLDPMAGRGTTLFWGARYGLESWGIEQDGKAPADLTRHVRRQAKLHRLKHDLRSGGRGKPGAFVDVTFHPPAGDVRVRLITGDSRDAVQLVQKKRFDLLVTDLPYGVQFVGKTRNPLKAVAACAPGWVECLAPGGVAVLVFNRLLPRRDALAQVFTDAGLEALPFEAPHRMSESIERDLLVFRKS